MRSTSTALVGGSRHVKSVLLVSCMLMLRCQAYSCSIMPYLLTVVCLFYPSDNSEWEFQKYGHQNLLLLYRKWDFQKYGHQKLLLLYKKWDFQKYGYFDQSILIELPAQVHSLIGNSNKAFVLLVHRRDCGYDFTFCWHFVILRCDITM